MDTDQIIWFKERHPISQNTIRKLAPAQTSSGGLLAFEDENADVYIEGMLGKFPSVKDSFPIGYQWNHVVTVLLEFLMAINQF